MVPTVFYLTPMGTFHLLFFGVGAVYGAIKTARRLMRADAPLPDRVAHLKAQAATLVMLTSLSLATAWLESLPLVPQTWPSWQAWAAGAAFYAAAVAFMRPRWRRAVHERRRATQLFMAQTRREKAYWVLVSLLAGVGEEITWRGVQFALFAYVLGNPWAAAVLCAVNFGLGHFLQGWKSMTIIAGFALAFQGLVWLSGSLVVAMAVHAAYDITAGFSYGRFGREFEETAR